MTNWKPYIFSEFLQINPTISLKGKETFSFIEMKDLNDGQRFARPSQERVISGGARFCEGDTLFARITPCLENGKICQAKGLKDGVGFGSTEFLVFRERKNISDRDFIYYLSRWEEVRRYAELNLVGTSGRQRVPKDVFDKLELTLPDLKIQKRIAEILSSFDDKIELNRRMNQTLEQMAQTLYQQYFVSDIDEDNLPEGWKKGSIYDVANVIYGAAFSSKLFNEKKEGLPLIRIRDLKDFTPQFFTTEKHSKATIINKGDIIVGMDAEFKPCIWQGERAYLNQRVCYFEPAQNYIHNYFIFEIIKPHLKFFEGAKVGTTVIHLGKSDIDTFKILVPHKDLFIKFYDLIDPIFNKIISNTAENNHLTNLRDTLLPKLMSGEIDVMQTKAEELYEPVLS